MKTKILLSFLSLGLFIACSDSDDSTKSKIAHMDIGDASTLFIAPNDINATRGSDYMPGQKVLFKITTDGVIKQVTYRDDNGKEVTEEYEPGNIIFVDDSPYFFVKFDGYYIVNKQTGAVYPSLNIEQDEEYLPQIGQTVQNGPIKFANEKRIKSDNRGNIYYSDHHSSGLNTIHKIDVSDINQLTDETLTPENDKVSMYVVSGNGELLYRYYRDGEWYQRLRTKSGRLIPFQIMGEYSGNDFLAWRGLDDNIHVFDRRAVSIIKFKGNDDYEVEDIIVDTCTIHGKTPNCIHNTVYALRPYPYLIKLSDRYIAFGAEGGALIIDSKDRSLITGEIHHVTDMKINDVQYNGSYIYCSGQLNGNYAMLRIDPYTFESETVIRDNDYEIYSFVVSNDNSIIFNGLRLSDAHNIIASIDPSGKVSLLQEVSSSTKITLNRLQ